MLIVLAMMATFKILTDPRLVFPGTLKTILDTIFEEA